QRPVGPIPGLTRVAPTNTDELVAAADYLRRTRLRTAMLVHDTNPKDLYTATLAAAFQNPQGPLDGYLSAGGDVTEPFAGDPGGSAVAVPGLSGVVHGAAVRFRGPGGRVGDHGPRRAVGRRQGDTERDRLVGRAADGGRRSGPAVPAQFAGQRGARGQRHLP